MNSLSQVRFDVLHLRFDQIVDALDLDSSVGGGTVVMGGHMRLADVPAYPRWPLDKVPDSARSRFDLRTFELAVDLREELLGRHVHRTKLAVLVNDVDGIPSKQLLLRDPTAAEMAAERVGVPLDMLMESVVDESAPNPIRAALLKSLEGFPHAYRDILDSGALRLDDSVVHGVSPNFYFKETTLRDQMDRMLKAAYRTRPNLNLHRRVRALGGPESDWREYSPLSEFLESDLVDEEGSQCRIATNGHSGCSGEIITLIRALYNQGVRRLVAFWPNECLNYVVSGCEIACKMFAIPRFEALNLAAKPTIRDRERFRGVYSCHKRGEGKGGKPNRKNA